MIEVLRPAKIVVSNDTGPGQIAAALGRPMVMMFSWSNPLRVGPYRRNIVLPYALHNLEISGATFDEAVLNIHFVAA